MPDLSRIEYVDRVEYSDVPRAKRKRPKWVSPFGDTSKEAFKQRLKDGCSSNWDKFVRLRCLLCETFDIPQMEAWTEASQFFPMDCPEFEHADFLRFKEVLIARFSKRLEIKQTKDGTLIRGECELTAAAQAALRLLPPGKGKFGNDDINWVLNHREFDAMDISEFPDRRLVTHWCDARKDFPGWSKTWAKHVIETKDPDAELKKALASERSEAEDHALNCDDLKGLLGKVDDA